MLVGTLVLLLFGIFVTGGGLAFLTNGVSLLICATAVLPIGLLIKNYKPKDEVAAVNLKRDLSNLIKSDR